MTEQLSPETTEQTSGARLAQARKDRNLSVADVASKLRIAPRQIEALEADDYERLPGHTIARGFVRNYARLLQLNPEAVLEAFEKHAPKEADARISLPDQKVQFSEPGNGHDNRTVLWLTLGLLLLTVLGYAWWRWEVSNAPTAKAVVTAPVSKSAAPAASVTPPVAALPDVESAPMPPSSVAPAAESTPPSIAEHVVHLAFAGAARVEIRDQSGKVVWKKTSAAGTEENITMAPPLAFIIGNAAKVKMTYNGDAFDLTPHIQGSIARFKLER